MLIQKMRLKRGWSQQQLAQASGLSVRTVQRIEGGHAASTETLKSIAAVFEVDFSTLTPMESTMDTASPNISLDEKLELEAFRYVKALKHFYLHLARYLVVGTGLVIFNLVYSPHHLWSLWALGGWGVGVLMQAMRIFGGNAMFGPDWERRQVENRLRRPL
jgi:transcriptional regulator with XRE-family HTH domain